MEEAKAQGNASEGRGGVAVGGDEGRADRARDEGMVWAFDAKLPRGAHVRRGRSPRANDAEEGFLVELRNIRVNDEGPEVVEHGHCPNGLVFGEQCIEDPDEHGRSVGLLRVRTKRLVQGATASHGCFSRRAE